MNHIVIFMLILHTFTHIHCSECIPATKLLHALVDKNNQPTPSFLELLDKTACFHDGTLSSIVESTQQWLRPKETERWEYNVNTIPMNVDLLHLFKNLCLVQEIKPSQKSYDYALFLGGSLDDVRTRLAYLLTLWNKGIRFGSLVILTGQRSLDKQIEGKELLLNNTMQLPYKRNWHFNGQFPTTESEMIKFVFEQTDTPKEWQKLPCISINTPIQQMENGSFRRPNTEDTIIEWLRKYHPHSGAILAISNQPFIGYQNAVLQKNMPHFTIETVGAAYSGNESIATIFDALARWIYNKNQIIHSQQAKY